MSQIRYGTHVARPLRVGPRMGHASSPQDGRLLRAAARIGPGRAGRDAGRRTRRNRRRCSQRLSQTPVSDAWRLAAIVVSATAFLAAVPFARVPLAPVAAFIPAYEGSLVIIDLITAVLLFGQFAQLRSAALLALATGYLFDGLMTIAHALSFPGLITPAGWLGAGSQTTAWLYMFWHGGFPLFVIAYAGSEPRRSTRQSSTRGRRGRAVVAVIAVAATADADSRPTPTGCCRRSWPATAIPRRLKFTVGTVWVHSPRRPCSPLSSTGRTRCSICG